jgi:CubicO group peptidase (beta-lactamase class C family)
MKLVDQHLISLDTSISAVLGYNVTNPLFPISKITPLMLLSHTSGIIDGSTYSDFLNATYNQNPMPNLSELLTPSGSFYTSDQFIMEPPGSWFNYSNINFIVVATLIEKVTGMRFDEFMRQEILIPMGISVSYNVNHIENLDNLAVLYRKSNGNRVAQANNYQGIQPVFGNLEGYIPGTNGGRFAPQGGLRITATDLSKIFQLLLNHGSHQTTQILSATAVEQMHNDQWTHNGSNGNNYYNLFNSRGLGIHRILNIPQADVVLTGSDAMFGHPGEAYGLVSDAYADTTRNLGLVFVANGCGVDYETNGESAFYTVEKQIFDALNPYADALNCDTLTFTAENNQTTEPRLFPNPVKDQLYISLSHSEAPVSFTLFDLYGQALLTGTTRGATTELSLGHLPAGLYLPVFDNNVGLVFRVWKL